MPSLTLDENHVYRIGGRSVKSTTQIIDASHLCDEWYKIRGQYIHQMCEMDLKGILDEETLDPQLRPYLDAFRLFRLHAPNLEGIFDWKSGQKMRWHLLQIGAYHELYRNGTDDAGTSLKGKKGMELKCYHPLYDYCGTIDYVNTDKPYPPAFDVYLKDNGKYSLEWVKDIKEHTQAFLHLRNAINVREKYKL